MVLTLHNCTGSSIVYTTTVRHQLPGLSVCRPTTDTSLTVYTVADHPSILWTSSPSSTLRPVLCMLACRHCVCLRIRAAAASSQPRPWLNQVLCQFLFGCVSFKVLLHRCTMMFILFIILKLKFPCSEIIILGPQ
jgi:hypothetical protein